MGDQSKKAKRRQDLARAIAEARERPRHGLELPRCAIEGCPQPATFHASTRKGDAWYCAAHAATATL